jgi:hypothetical protein
MGGQSSTTQQSQTAPWEAAQPMLRSILGQLNTGPNNTGLTPAETGALNTLQSNVAQGNPFAGAIGSFANDRAAVVATGNNSISVAYTNGSQAATKTVPPGIILNNIMSVL